MVLDLFRLDGKCAVVTGCSRGIGKSLAIALAEAGADIIGVSRTLSKTGSDVEREVVARGRAFHGYACDFAQRAAIRDLAAALSRNHPVIDILINNAGTIRRTPAARSDHALLTREWTPLEPGVVDHKHYVRGVGTAREETVRGGDELNELVAVRR